MCLQQPHWHVRSSHLRRVVFIRYLARVRFCAITGFRGPGAIVASTRVHGNSIDGVFYLVRARSVHVIFANDVAGTCLELQKLERSEEWRGQLD